MGTRVKTGTVIDAVVDLSDKNSQKYLTNDVTQLFCNVILNMHLSVSNLGFRDFITCFLFYFFILCFMLSLCLSHWPTHNFSLVVVHSVL